MPRFSTASASARSSAITCSAQVMRCKRDPVGDLGRRDVAPSAAKPNTPVNPSSSWPGRAAPAAPSAPPYAPCTRVPAAAEHGQGGRCVAHTCGHTPHCTLLALPVRPARAQPAGPSDCWDQRATKFCLLLADLTRTNSFCIPCIVCSGPCSTSTAAGAAAAAAATSHAACCTGAAASPAAGCSSSASATDGLPTAGVTRTASAVAASTPSAAPSCCAASAASLEAGSAAGAAAGASSPPAASASCPAHPCDAASACACSSQHVCLSMVEIRGQSGAQSGKLPQSRPQWAQLPATRHCLNGRQPPFPHLNSLRRRSALLNHCHLVADKPGVLVLHGMGDNSPMEMSEGAAAGPIHKAGQAAQAAQQACPQLLQPVRHQTCSRNTAPGAAHLRPAGMEQQASTAGGQTSALCIDVLARHHTKRLSQSDCWQGAAPPRLSPQTVPFSCCHSPCRTVQ